jgi:hypothetical protein
MPTLTALTVLLSLLGPPASPPRLRIDLVFKGDPMSRELKAAAMAEATAIWATYNIQIREVSDEDASRGDGAVKLAVAVAERPARNVSPDALGSIYFVDGVPTAAIILYPNTIASLVPPSMMLGPGVHERSPFDYNRMVGRVAGRALAHEIGHYLLRMRGHSAEGLMRANPMMNEMIELNRRGFALADHDLRRLLSFMPEYSRSNEGAAPALEESALRGVLAAGDRRVVR